ncbi:MAG: hypothetical protein DHS20C21_12440 [Gemmatimonadota bacterium]|nr:MAG: hypothetical protein DHS20C21_12440 [Gemmatimonadota bacterium]
MSARKRFWRPLGAIAVLVGCGVLVYAVQTGIRDRNEPLIGVFVALVAIPAIVPAVLGFQMMRGTAWAAWALRISIGGSVVGGALLDFGMGLDVFSLPQLAVPLILGAMAWLAFSFL